MRLCSLLLPTSLYDWASLVINSVLYPSPGDYLQHADDEIEGFKGRLNERLAPVGSQFSGEGVNEDWEVGDALAQWWRPNFETFMYPFLPGHVTRPKECKKLYFIQLPKKSACAPCFYTFHPWGSMWLAVHQPYAFRRD